ncbi:hypothetical protein ScPMuIL_000707 [Solemya velum]
MSTGTDSCHQYIKSLMNADTDNDRFAALLMIAKCTKLEDYDETSRLQLLDAIGSKFLIRLLKTKSVPEGCPPTVFRSVAVSILSVLCLDPKLCVHPVITGAITYLNDILSSLLADICSEDEERNLESDIFDCIRSLATTELGREQLLKHGTVPVLTNLITNKNGNDKAFELLFSLVGSCGADTWANCTASCNQLLCHLSQQFKKTENEKTFELCKYLSLVIATVSRNKVCLSLRHQWLVDIVSTLDGIFRSKIGAAQREPALGLLSALVTSLGLEAILPPYTADTKFIILLTHLSCIEVRMVLENSSFEEIEQKASVLMSCYSLLENMITELTTNPLTFPTDVHISKLHTSLTGAFGAVIYHLSQVAKDYSEMTPTPVTIATIRVLGIWLAEETTALRNEVYDILPFLVQICKHCHTCHKDRRSKSSRKKGCKESHNQTNTIKDGTTNSSTKEFDSSASQTPSAVDSSSQIADQLKNKDLGSKPSAISCIPLDSFRQAAYMTNLEEIDLLKFLLPGFCHLTAEDEPRKVLLDENFHVFLQEYLTDCWKDFRESGDNTSESTSRLVVICNNFLNLVVTEPVLATDHPTFHTLTDFVLATSQDLSYRPECIVLMANLLVLGIMLLRNQESRRDINEDLKRKFFLSLGTFLSGAFTSSGNKTKRALSVTELYEPHWDDISQTWFLSMQDKLLEC